MERVAGIGHRSKSADFAVDPVSAPSRLRLSIPKIFLERVAGIEPATQPWEGYILPLNHTRKTTIRLANFIYFLKIKKGLFIDKL